jgi:hypothetical protein
MPPRCRSTTACSTWCAASRGLQFFLDPAAAFAEAHRVLVPAGRVALAVWCPIEHNPAFAAFACTLERHVGAEVAALMRAPFGGPGSAQLDRLLAQASFASVRTRIADIEARFPSPREFLHRQVVGSPLATPIAALAPHRLAALADDVERILDPYSEGDGIVLPMQTFLVAARRR